MSGYGDSPTLIPTNPSTDSNSGTPPSTTSNTPSSTDSNSGTPPSTTSNTPSTNSSGIAIITTTSVAGVVILITIAIMGYIYIRKKRQNAVTSKESLIEEFSKEKPVRFTPRDLVAFTQNYSHPLGSGGFGDVYKGAMYNGVPVAVKKLKKISDNIVNDQFTAELFSIGRTYHVNLVKLYGFCFNDKVKALVYEYMDNGSLESCLNDKCKLDWETLHQIAIGTARGIRYLHEECHKVIIHYDIKPGNVLLSTDFSPKVADFGMAELWDRESALLAVTLGRGTPGFIAPELSQTLPSTPKCDIYSFGMLLFQILGSRRIAEGLQADTQQKSAIWVREKAEQGDFGSILSSCGIKEKDRVKAETMAKVALLCVQHQPEKRPSMSIVLGMLKGEQDIVVCPLSNNVPSVGSDGSDIKKGEPDIGDSPVNKVPTGHSENNVPNVGLDGSNATNNISDITGNITSGILKMLEEGNIKQKEIV